MVNPNTILQSYREPKWCWAGNGTDRIAQHTGANTGLGPAATRYYQMTFLAPAPVAAFGGLYGEGWTGGANDYFTVGRGSTTGNIIVTVNDGTSESANVLEPAQYAAGDLICLEIACPNPSTYNIIARNITRGTPLVESQLVSAKNWWSNPGQQAISFSRRMAAANSVAMQWLCFRAGTTPENITVAYDFSGGGGSVIHDRVGNKHLTIEGTGLGWTADTVSDYSRLRNSGYDRWAKTGSADIYVPLRFNGDSIIGKDDTPPAADYVHAEKYYGLEQINA